MTTARFFLGVDGGATRCRARLRDSSGRELGHGLGPSANIYVDFDDAIRVVRETIESVIAAGVARQEIAVGLGLAGVSEDKEAERIAAALPDFARVVTVNDAVAACVGANGLGDGGLIIAGTGSAGIARVGATTTIIGGRGFQLGDDRRKRSPGTTAPSRPKFSTSPSPEIRVRAKSPTKRPGRLRRSRMC